MSPKWRVVFIMFALSRIDEYLWNLCQLLIKPRNFHANKTHFLILKKLVNTTRGGHLRRKLPNIVSNWGLELWYRGIQLLGCKSLHHRNPLLVHISVWQREIICALFKTNATLSILRDPLNLSILFHPWMKQDQANQRGRPFVCKVL